MARTPKSSLQTSDEPGAPVKRRGRPSIALARRAEIVEAYVDCIREHGMSGATVDKVAQALGLSRTLVFHYFGDMRALSRAVVEHIVTGSVRGMTEGRKGLPIAERRRVMVDFVVNGPSFGELRDLIVQAEVNALAGHDPDIAAMLSEMWEVWIAAVVDELSVCFPDAERGRCEWVGYALSCLGEQHWWLTFIGPGATRRAEARKAAESLIATLQTPGETQ
ncbi:MAG TPA: TetR/AcrR family transcriptional regulator [Caulobacteraceae bacterium]|jgi:AcrR family transcriptional regulator|nr:TetR/AcrR family transcriptional regulator [Caulobacteraceae bacterium]